MELSKDTVLYFDTNALRSLGLNKIIAILSACGSGEISVTLSYWVIWEYARQQFFGETMPIISPAEVAKYFAGKNESESLQYYHLCNLSFFRENGVTIIDHSADIEELSKRLIADPNTYFSSEKRNDGRDALIFASAIIHLDQKNTIVFCDETKLITEFSRKGYNVKNSDLFPRIRVMRQESSP